MKRIINNGRRRLGISGRPAIILGPGESQEIDDRQAKEISEHRVTKSWLQTGVIEIRDDDAPTETKHLIKPEKPAVVSQTVRPGAPRDERSEEAMPEDLSGEGAEIHHLGGGWFQVWINGIRVTDRNVRKDEAKEIASEYE